MTIDWEEARKVLARQFDKSEVKTYDGGRSGTLSYIDARQVMERLDEAVGPENWSTQYTLIDPVRMAVECRLTVGGVTKCDVGYPNNPADFEPLNPSRNDAGFLTGKNGQPRPPQEAEPLKAAFSDAFKRAAVHFGVGRHLYHSPPPPKAKSLASTVSAILRNKASDNEQRRLAVRQYIVNNYGELSTLDELSKVPENILREALEVK